MYLNLPEACICIYLNMFKHVPFASIVPPTIQSSQSTVYHIQGQHVQLNCTFGGLPVPNITWTTPNSSNEFLGKIPAKNLPRTCQELAKNLPRTCQDLAKTLPRMPRLCRPSSRQDLAKNLPKILSKMIPRYDDKILAKIL